MQPASPAKASRRRDVTDVFWIKTKAVLLVLLGVFAAGLIVFEKPTVQVALLLLLLLITGWACCRAYYFAF